MLRLHDNVRRWVCRAAFVLFCVTPTVGAAFWCMDRHLPGTADAEARRLETVLGLDVTLDALCHPRPGRVRYDGLILTDSETGQGVLRCQSLDTSWTSSAPSSDQKAPALTFTATEPEFDANGLARFMDLCDAMLRDRVAGLPAEVRFIAGKAALVTPDGPQAIVDLEGTFARLEEGARMDVAFRLPDNDSTAPIRIRVVRNRQCTPPATGFEIDTAGAAVPCRLLAAALPSFAPLGKEGRFRGYLWSGETTDGQSATGWDGELSGELLDVDLDGLLSKPLGRRLTGTARLTIHSARFRAGRLDTATGTLTAGPGTAARPLVEALAGELGLARGTLLATAGDVVSYEQMAFAFRIDATGLQLRGQCSGPVAGAVLVDGQGPLLGEPRLQPVAVAALVRAIAPGVEVPIPATRQAERLLGRLPAAY